MSLLPLPPLALDEFQMQGYAYDAEKFSTFTIDEIFSDTSHFKFGRNAVDRPSEIMMRGRVCWRPSMSWCQPMPKISVGIPTLYKPVQLQLKIVTTIDETGETWIGFYVSVEDICTLKNWENWAYLNLFIRTAFQEKRGKYIQFSPANNCWGWSKCFRLTTMTACKGNPFIIDIGLEHNPVPLFQRLPGLSLHVQKDHPKNFNEEWEMISKIEIDIIQEVVLQSKGDNSGVTDEASSSNYSLSASASAPSAVGNSAATCSMDSNSFCGKNAKYKRQPRHNVGRRGSGGSVYYSQSTNSNREMHSDADRAISQNSNNNSTTRVFSNRSRPNSSTYGGGGHHPLHSNPGSSGESNKSNHDSSVNKYSHGHRRKVRSAV